MKNRAYTYKRMFVFLVIFTILIMGIVFVGVVIRMENRRMRAELLIQARMLEMSINVKRVLNLSGSENDLNAPDYQRLKDQLTRARFANPQCRFVYLMGRQPDGEVFFFVDSEPPDSKDYSPPGQIYSEISPALINVFVTGKESVEGPVSDRWGSWVSALVPLIDSETGKLVAVLGMDIDARNWKMLIIYRSSPPAIITLLIFLLLGIFLFIQHKNEQEQIQLAISKIALQQSEKSFQQLFENMADGVAIYQAVDEGGNFVFVNLNKKGEEISQVKRKNIIGRRVTDVFPSTAEIGLLGVLQRVWRTGVSEYLPGILYKDKRIEHWTENYVLRLSAGLVVSIYSNITRRKQPEDEILSLARFPTEDPSPVLRIARDGKLLFVNQAGLKRLVNWRLQIGQLVLPMLRDLVFRALESGLEEQCDLEHGEQVYSFHIVPIVKSNYANLYGLDITVQKLAEEALKESERKVRALFDHSSHFIGLMTVDGILIEANRTALEFSGVEASSVLNKYFWQGPWWVHSLELQEKVRQAVEKVAHGEFIRFEATHVSKDGVSHYVDFSLKPVKDETGKVIFLVPEGRDITELKQAEQKLRKDLHDLEVFYKASIGREERILELKNQIKDLKHKSNNC